MSAEVEELVALLLVIFFRKRMTAAMTDVTDSGS